MANTTLKSFLAIYLLYEEDSDGDDEDDQRIAVCAVLLKSTSGRRPRHRQMFYIENVIHTFRLDEFKTFFRVCRSSVDILLEWISRTCQDEHIAGITERESTGGMPQVPLEKRVLVLLWYLASLDKYSSIADRFGLSESTACDATRTLANFISQHLLDKIIQWPSQNECIEISSIYRELKHFDGVVGMIDGTHIPIKQPSERGTDYYNRKDFYSVVLQAVVREDMQFTNVYTGWPGKVHDSRVFRNSPLFEIGPQLCNGNRHILGDSAYPNLVWCLVPFRDDGHLTPAQRRYNKTHASIRSVVERAFGLLKGRFVRLRYIDQRHIRTIVTTILSACVLHNICILNNDEFQEILEGEHVVPEFGDGHEAAVKRLTIARNLLQKD
ncbi:uncharacterized protein [Antedon mediterranea]|uniref:uncharacterized protein n=1 Tax=Antedon mediterranea TaxID=105859 RepID=UPI003AF74DAC